MDQGILATEGSVLAPVSVSPRWLTPLRAVLLMLGAVLCGVALSLILGSSPAHAAEGDGDGSGTGQSLLGSVTGVVTSTVDTTVPLVQHTVTAVGGSVVATVPPAAPIVTPVVTTVSTTLTAVQQLVAPVAHTVLPLADAAATPIRTLALDASAVSAAVAVQGSAGATVEPIGSGSDGTQPDPILTSSAGAPLAALGVLLAVFALVLLAGRRRLDDDALPASPAFETDTSPA